MKIMELIRHNPLENVFDEACMPVKIRRSLYFIILGNIMGSAHGVICGGGTTAMIGLATQLGANDITFGILSVVLRLGFTLLLVPRFARDNEAGPMDMLRHIARSAVPHRQK